MAEGGVAGCSKDVSADSQHFHQYLKDLISSHTSVGIIRAVAAVKGAIRVVVLVIPHLARRLLMTASLVSLDQILHVRQY